MKLETTVSSSWNAGWVALGVWLGDRLKKGLYIYLAAFFTIFAIADTAVFHFAEKMRLGAFDAILHYRIVKPKADPDIVIVDINEASLAAMGKEFGRWPWPRQVLGEFVELVEKQNPQAIVFDILFSDADVYNPDSDAYFNEVIAETSNTFFPMLRLDPANDSLSQLKASMMPGVEKWSNQASKDATLAVVLPQFQAAIDGGRLGFHNVYSDDDGVVRQYPVFSNDYGWKLTSLPARIAKELKWPFPDERSVLLNWRGPPFTYNFVSFSDVFNDLTSKERRRPADEFKGKILIIGSTAPSLYDIKPTSMSQVHPGVEILATAIDNLKHDDYLRFPKAQIPYLLLALAIVWLTAWGFTRGIDPVILDRWFGLSQFVLISVSYASINFSNVYINLTGPISLALAYYSVTRFYASLTRKALEKSMVRVTMGLSGECQATLLLIRLDTHGISDAGWEILRSNLSRAGKEEKSVEVMRVDQKGMWSLFEKTFAVCWIASLEDKTAEERFELDAQVVVDAFPVLASKHLPSIDGLACWFVHHGRISCGEAAEESWRVLFGEALMQWQISRAGKRENEK